jgi:hypothetical protein
MKLKRIAATVWMAGALGMTALGAAGAAQADPRDDWWLPNPPGPGVLPPPGHIGHITGVPPGHWDDVFPIPFCKNLNPGCINHL